MKPEARGPKGKVTTEEQIETMEHILQKEWLVEISPGSHWVKNLGAIHPVVSLTGHWPPWTTGNALHIRKDGSVNGQPKEDLSVYPFSSLIRVHNAEVRCPLRPAMFFSPL